MSNYDIHINNIKEIIKEYNTKDNNDMKRLMVKLKRYFKTNPDANSIDTKELNAEINIDGYVFCKRGNQQQLIKKYYVPRCGTQDASHPYTPKGPEPTAYVPRTEISDVNSNISCKPQSPTSHLNHRSLQVVNDMCNHDSRLNQIEQDIDEIHHYVETLIDSRFKEVDQQINKIYSIIESIQKASYGCKNGYASLLGQFH